MVAISTLPPAANDGFRAPSFSNDDARVVCGTAKIHSIERTNFPALRAMRRASSTAASTAATIRARAPSCPAFASSERGTVIAISADAGHRLFSASKYTAGRSTRMVRVPMSVAASVTPGQSSGRATRPAATAFERV
jgi:hypothetical protein